MAEKSPLSESIKIWQNYALGQKNNTLEYELDIHKKLLNFLQVGDYLYWVFNLSTLDFDFLSPGFKTILGFENEDVNLSSFFNTFHPEDQKWYTNFENEVGKFLHGLPVEKRMSYKVRMDFRVRKKDGNYIRVLYQNICIQLFENGNIHRSLGLMTDISHLKLHGRPMLSFIGLDGEPSYIDVKPGEILIPIDDPISKREKEILLLIIDGKLNKEIAHILHISKETVDKHRKNMIKKNNCTNSNELIALAIKNGWL